MNRRKHASSATQAVGRDFDVCSSAWWLDGWDRPPSPLGPPYRADDPPVAPAETWLLQTGWKRHGLIRVDESPRLMARSRISMFFGLRILLARLFEPDLQTCLRGKPPERRQIQDRRDAISDETRPDFAQGVVLSWLICARNSAGPQGGSACNSLTAMPRFASEYFRLFMIPHTSFGSLTKGP
jgi:hypothetical protein